MMQFVILKMTKFINQTVTALTERDGHLTESGNLRMNLKEQ